MKAFDLKDIDWKHWCWLSAILLVAAYLRYKGMTTQSFWVDEMSTMRHIKPTMSLADFFASIRTVKHPPLHALLLRAWTRIFEFNDYWARAMSVLIGVAGIGAAYFLGRNAIDKKLGLILAWVSTLNFFQLYYSQEVRSYGLVFLLTCLSFAFFIRTFRQTSWRQVVILGIINALLLYTHYFAVFVIFAQCLLLGLLAIKRDLVKFNLAKMCLAYLISLLLFLPWLPTWFDVTSWDHFDRYLYLGGEDLITAFSKFFAGDTLHISIILSCIMLAVIAVSNESMKKSSNLKDHPLQLTSMVVLVWVLIGIGCPYLLSLPPFHQTLYDKFIFVDRYLMICLPAILLLVSVGIHQISSFWTRTAMLSLLSVTAIIAFTVTFGFYVRTYKVQARHAAHHICTSNTDDLQVFTRFLFKVDFYFNQQDCAIAEYKEDLPIADLPDKFWFYSIHGDIPLHIKQKLSDQYDIAHLKKYYRAYAYKWERKQEFINASSSETLHSELKGNEE